MEVSQSCQIHGKVKLQPELKVATSIMKREEELIREVESLKRANLE